MREEGSNGEEELSIIDVNEMVTPPKENAESELSRPITALYCYQPNIFTVQLSKDWNTLIYVFFKPIPVIEYIDNHQVHVFECSAVHCKGRGRFGCFIQRYLDTGDARSTGNTRHHTKGCLETVSAADNTKDVHTARDVMAKARPHNGSITAVFERAGKNCVTYSHRQLTKAVSW